MYLNYYHIYVVEKPYGPIHIGMILSTLNLNPHGFVFGLFPQKASYQLDVIHGYILISLLIPKPMGDICETLDVHPTILPGSSLTMWVEAKQNCIMGPLADGASSKACARMQLKKS